MNKTIITIDPGKNGGIAIQLENGFVHTHKMPQTYPDIHDLLKEYTDRDPICYMEKVHGMPKQGGAAMFTFGQGYGWLQMALYALQIPINDITPQAWTKAMGIGTKGQCATPVVWKNKLKQKAQGLYPTQNITLWSTDCLLMLHYVNTVLHVKQKTKGYQDSIPI